MELGTPHPPPPEGRGDTKLRPSAAPVPMGAALLLQHGHADLHLPAPGLCAGWARELGQSWAGRRFAFGVAIAPRGELGSSTFWVDLGLGLLDADWLVQQRIWVCKVVKRAH